MSVVRRFVALCCTALVSALLVVAAPFLTGPAAAATELLVDGGFESSTATDPPNSPGWTETDNRQGAFPGSPLCPSSNCSISSVYTPPHTGSFWARFGGPVTTFPHIASLSQSVTIPSGGTAVLTYWYRNGRVAQAGDATLQVRVDGTTLKTHTEASTAETVYTQQTVNLSAYANGASHTISFNYAKFNAGDNRMGVDDISLSYTPPAVTTTPTVTSTTPASPSSSTTPLVKGTADPASTVTLYSNSSCTTALGSGSGASFVGSGITATVPANATTTIYAKATRSGQANSACSSTFVSYTSDSTAPAQVTFSGVSPTSPGTSTTPAVRGTAEAGSTVKLFKTSDCSGTPAATGTAAAFASPGITASVTANASTTFKATATDAAGNTSACSATWLTYVNDSTAPALVTLSAVAPGPTWPTTTPSVTGTAEAGSTVTLYSAVGCAGSPVATGSAAAFASIGLTPTVTVGTTTTFRARATDAAGNTSACSTSTVTFTSNMLDGGFEATVGTDSPYWTEADSLAGSPLCTSCVGTSPHSGHAWAWFGGFADPGHTGGLTQVLTIPVGTKSLTYWYENLTVSDPFDAQLVVRVDATTVKSHTEATVADTSYALQFANISAFADGGIHVLSFSYTNGGAGVNNMLVDDLSLSALTAAATATPTVASTTVPASGSTSTTTLVTGTAQAGATVTLYGNAACSGAPLGTGPAATFASPGIVATVPANTTTAIHALATKAGQDDSACSTTSASYTQKDPASAPETFLTKTPHKKVWTHKRSMRVAFLFSASAVGATFQCSIDAKAFAVCTPGHRFRLKLGKHTFAVRAVAQGLVDPTPATFKVKVKVKRRARR